MSYTAERYEGLEWWEIGDEEWRRLPSAPNYEVSELGQIRNAHSREIVNPLTYRHSARLFVVLPGRQIVYLHNAVAERFIGPCPAGMRVTHRDSNWRNNRVNNLEYVTIDDYEKRRAASPSYQPALLDPGIQNQETRGGSIDRSSSRTGGQRG